MNETLKLSIKTGTWALIRFRPWHFVLSVGLMTYAFGHAAGARLAGKKLL
jgi:hypothetical protein